MEASPFWTGLSTARLASMGLRTFCALHSGSFVRIACNVYSGTRWRSFLLGCADQAASVLPTTVMCTSQGFPDTPNDVRTQYKICGVTTLLFTPIWVEASQEQDTRYLQVTNTFFTVRGQNRSVLYAAAALMYSSVQRWLAVQPHLFQ